MSSISPLGAGSPINLSGVNPAGVPDNIVSLLQHAVKGDLGSLTPDEIASLRATLDTLGNDILNANYTDANTQLGSLETTFGPFSAIYQSVAGVLQAKVQQATLDQIGMPQTPNHFSGSFSVGFGGGLTWDASQNATGYEILNPGGTTTPVQGGNNVGEFGLSDRGIYSIVALNGNVASVLSSTTV